MKELQIEWIPVEQINPSPYNPRKKLKPSDPEYRKLKKSIKQFGYVDPLIWNKRTGHLVGGHQRFQILKDEGVDRVQVSVVDLNLEQKKALNLALNRISGKWDESLLSSLLAELDDDLLSITGFEDEEIQKLLKTHETNVKTEFLTSFIESKEKTESNPAPNDAPKPFLFLWSWIKP
jgi:ParB-like chromosome segregation protein Spo0J